MSEQTDKTSERCVIEQPPGWRCRRLKHATTEPCATVPTKPVSEVASVIPTITGEGASVWLFQSLCIATFVDVDEAFRTRDSINAEAEVWMHELYDIARDSDD